MSAGLSYEKLLAIKKELDLRGPQPKALKIHPLVWPRFKKEIPEAENIKSGDKIFGLPVYIDPTLKTGWKLEY